VQRFSPAAGQQVPSPQVLAPQSAGQLHAFSTPAQTPLPQGLQSPGQVVFSLP
jgi:hypothetical protein